MPNIALNQANLSQLKIPSLPNYNRNLPRSIVHIGVGNFHRAHQAFYLNQLSNLTQQNEWGLCGVEIRPNPVMEENFKKQDCLYSLIVRSKETTETSVIGSIIDYIYAADDTSKAVEILSKPEVRIASLTVTENGYNQDKTTGKVNFSDPDIIHDLNEENRNCPKTAIGVITRALQIRLEKGLKPFTVMSCDNLSENGKMAKNCILEFTKKLENSVKSENLLKFISEKVTFPNSMVDRITPARSTENEKFLQENFNLEDKIPVMCEDFIQWVIEDKFCNGRPNWEILDGVTIVEDVVPYELVKLRILNAGHFALSYPAALASIKYVDEAMEEKALADFVSGYMDSVIPSLPKNIPGIDVQEYKATVIKRFKNPAISDKIERLLKDGSSKVAEFVCGALEYLLDKDLDMKCGILVIAFMIVGYSKIGDNTSRPLKNGMQIDDIRFEELSEICKSIWRRPSMPKQSLDEPPLYGYYTPEKIWSYSVKETKKFIQRTMGEKFANNKRFVERVYREAKDLYTRSYIKK